MTADRDLAILVPVLGRPHRVEPLLTSIEAATPEAHVVFLCDPDDEPEHDAITAARRLRDLNVTMLCEGGNYAHKINVGVRSTTEPLIFLGADDLEPLPGWFEKASRYTDEGAQVVGVNDLLPRRGARREHATHFLMTRDYAELPTIDGGSGPLHEGYRHSWSDNELIATARHRIAYAYAEDSHVRHLHPDGGLAEWDEIYEKGRADIHLDGRLYRRRAHLWAT